MTFAPIPTNDFKDFIDTYFRRCAEVCPKLRGIAGKWTFEDLIPGLSDFDARFIYADGVTIAEWARMSTNVGKIHTQLAREHQEWARILEHNPGQNLTLSEMLDPVLFNPESRQWTFYKGDESILAPIRRYLADKPWERRDEIFVLKKFAIYYGPYLRGIDPAVNIGPWENKYPLHSRFMHYFSPPVQVAVSLVLKKGIIGKFDALRQARELFPDPDVIDMILDTAACHYEVEEYYREHRLSEIERRLEAYLYKVYSCLSDHVTLIEVDPTDTPEQLRAKVAAIPIDPAERFCEGTRFGRLMKGRLQFYGVEIPWFDTDWLIPNEVNRMGKNFFEAPLKAYGLARWHEDLAPDMVLDRLRGNLLTGNVCDGVKRFVELTRQPIENDKKQRALEMAEVYEPIQVMMETLREDLRCVLARRKG